MYQLSQRWSRHYRNHTTTSSYVGIYLFIYFAATFFSPKHYWFGGCSWPPKPENEFKQTEPTKSFACINFACFFVVFIIANPSTFFKLNISPLSLTFTFVCSWLRLFEQDIFHQKRRQEACMGCSFVFLCFVFFPLSFLVSPLFLLSLPPWVSGLL